MTDVAKFENSYLGMTETKQSYIQIHENTVLKRTFGRKREEVLGGWRKLNY
jgi:hypothetical protein